MASDEEISRRVTSPEMHSVAGNLVFVQAASTLSLDPGVARQLLKDVLLAHGVMPSQLTRDALREHLPDVEKRLHVLVNDALAAQIMDELTRFVDAPR